MYVYGYVYLLHCIMFSQIAGYIFLRNVSGALRTRFSAFFAWFGQFWVELLVGQYHVWMGGKLLTEIINRLIKVIYLQDNKNSFS